MLTLSSLLFCVSRIDTDNKTDSPSGVLVYSLDLCGAIISVLNCSPMSPITKALPLVIISYLIVCRNVHENMVLRATPSTRARETVTGFPFTARGFL